MFVKSKRCFVILSICVIAVSAVACKKGITDNDLYAVKYLLNDLNYSSVEITKFERYVVNEDTSYYYCQWSTSDLDDATVNNLLVFDNEQKIGRRVYFQDMEAGFDKDVQAVWEKIKDNNPDKSFSEREINKLIKNAQKK